MLQVVLSHPWPPFRCPSLSSLLPWLAALQDNADLFAEDVVKQVEEQRESRQRLLAAIPGMIPQVGVRWVGGWCWWEPGGVGSATVGGQHTRHDPAGGGRWRHFLSPVGRGKVRVGYLGVGGLIVGGQHPPA